jgi:hypothetical protein
MAYCTESDVRAYTSVTILEASSSTVTDIISVAESLINNITGTIFSTGTVTGEVHDDSGNGIIDINYLPIISITKVEYSDDYGSTYNILSSDNYYSKDWAIKIKKYGDIGFYEGHEQRFKVGYSYGHASCPVLVKHVCTMLAGVLLACYVKDNPKNMFAVEMRLKRSGNLWYYDAYRFNTEVQAYAEYFMGSINISSSDYFLHQEEQFLISKKYPYHFQYQSKIKHRKNKIYE